MMLPAGDGALYEMVVTHVRRSPVHHALRYRIFTILIDLDRIERQARVLRLFSCGRFNLMSFMAADHGRALSAPTPAGLKSWAQDIAMGEGIDVGGGRVVLSCMPRVLGHAFNPISVFFCTDAKGVLRAVLYEVNNTFGERHVYVAAVPDAADERLRHDMPKRFHVSPFMAMDMHYDFALRVPGRVFSLAIRTRDTASGDVVIDAVMRGERRPLGDGQILRLVARMPVLGLKVWLGIHWEALKLWRKKLTFHKSPAAGPFVSTGKHP